MGNRRKKWATFIATSVHTVYDALVKGSYQFNTEKITVQKWLDRALNLGRTKEDQIDDSTGLWVLSILSVVGLGLLSEGTNKKYVGLGVLW